MSLVLLYVLSYGQLETRDESKSYDALKSLDNSKGFIKRIWRGQGDVILGRLEIPDETKVSSRVPIRKDGSFCTPLYFGRKLMFYAHGYDALEAYHLPKPKVWRPRPEAAVFDVGQLVLEKSKENDLRNLKVLPVLIDDGEKKTALSCSLSIQNNDYLWQDHGYSGGARVQVNVESKRVLSGTSVDFQGLSRIPYVLKLSAPAYVSQEFKIDPKANGVIDLQEITLIPAVKYKFSYRARIRKKQGEWIEDKNLKTEVVFCDGKAEFNFTKERDGLGNFLSLRLKPTNQGVQASFFYVKQNSFYQLENNDLGAVNDWGKIDTTQLKGMSRVYLEGDSLYLFRVQEINGTEIQLLFKPEMM